MAAITNSVKQGASFFKDRKYKDFSEKLSSHYGAIIGTVFTILATGVQTFGDTVDCIPNNKTHLENVNLDLVDEYCRRTGSLSERGYEQIITDKSAPLMLAVQTLFFIIPGMLFQKYLSYAGYDIEKLVAILKDQQAATTEKRKGNVTTIANVLDELLKYRRYVEHKPTGCEELIQTCPAGCFKLLNCCYQNSIIIIYILTKLIHFGATLTQFFIFTFFVEGWGIRKASVELWHLASSIGKGSSFFPSLATCEFRAQSTDIPVLFECILPYSSSLERGYLMFYWWIFMVLLCSGLSFLHGFWRLNSRFIVDNLVKIKKLQNAKDQKDLVTNFKKDYLGREGIFVLHKISAQLNGLPTAEICGALWDEFKTHNGLNVQHSSTSYEAKPNLAGLVGSALYDHDVKRESTSDETAQLLS